MFRALSTEERAERLGQLTMDGCLVEDLGLDFTLPSYPVIELRKVSSAAVQQFSCFLSPSSPARHGVVVQCTVLYYAMQGGREMNVICFTVLYRDVLP